jgi:hypothetical protein
LALVIFYAVLGFLYLYLWSRTVLMGELARGDAAAQAAAAAPATPGP